MTEIEILVPVAVQTCGTVPEYHWRFPQIAIHSYDDVSVETVYELRRVRVPKDATAYKVEAGANSYVCFRGDPPPFEKKKRGGMPDDGAEGPFSTLQEQENDWRPLGSVEEGEWEDTGRYIRPLSSNNWLALGTGTPVEAYGISASLGAILPDMVWDDLVVASSAVDQSTDIDERGWGFSIGLLTGIGDFKFGVAEWEGEQSIHVVGLDSLGRPIDEYVQRALTFQWITVSVLHPLAMAELYHSAEWSFRVDLRLGAGVGALLSKADSTFSPLGPAAPSQEEREVSGFVSGAAQCELRHKAEWSLVARVEWSNNFPVSGGADLSEFITAEISIEWRW